MRPIRGSGDDGAAEAPKHDVKPETEVAVAAEEVSCDLDVIDAVVLPQAEPHVHSNPGDDFDDHSGDDSDDDGEPVNHLYPFMWQIYPRVSSVTPISPFLE